LLSSPVLRMGEQNCLGILAILRRLPPRMQAIRSRMTGPVPRWSLYLWLRLGQAETSKGRIALYAVCHPHQQ
ncbi:MAG: hypothetical protein ACHQ7N_14960, partial [Candidatus Methylomirabilales bacterium]